jgi:glycosyltransferase involved in cell wall biosynthesis
LLTNKHITYLFRAPRVGSYSIEELFNNVKTEVSNYYKTKTKVVSHIGGSPLTLFKNIVKFRRINEGGICHITGDINYMAIAAGKRAVLTIHDVNSLLQGNIFKRFYHILFWLWIPALSVRYITVISEYTRKELLRVVPFATKKIKVIPNAVHREFKYSHYNFNSESPTILCIGTKINKNIEKVILAVEPLKCQLHIIGPLTKNQEDLLKFHSIAYKNSNALSRSEIVQVYQNSDILCFPSLYEGFGMPIIEAQAVGRPVITSNLGAMKEVAGKGAILVDPNSLEDIRNGILRLIKEDELRSELIHNGLENVKRFDLKRITEQYVVLYQQME